MLTDVIFAFFFSLLLNALFIKYAFNIGMVDEPNHRSSHTIPVARGAGIAIFLSFIITVMLFHFDIITKNSGFFLGITIVFLAGVIDDKIEINPKTKFAFLIIATLLIYYLDDIKITYIGTYFGYTAYLYWWMVLPFTVFAVVGYTNALNLVDGLDGLAGLISLIIFISYFYIGYIHFDQFMIVVSLFMSVALIGFLFFNWNPAKVFMGDSGSLVLGFAIAAVSIKATQYISVTSVLFLTAIPIIDTLTVMIRRLQRGISPLNADKNHMHHRIKNWKDYVDYTVLMLGMIQLCFSLIGVRLHEQHDTMNLIIFIVMFFLFFNFLDPRNKRRQRLTVTEIRLKFLKFMEEKGININSAIYIFLTLFVMAVFLKLYF